MAGHPDPLDGLAGLPAALADAVTATGLVDHHVHGCFTEPLDRQGFEDALNEASTDPVPEFMTQLDSQLGFAIRRWCAPALGLDPHASAEDYWATRRAREPDDLARALLPLAGVEHWLVDTGHAASRVGSAAHLATVSGSTADEIARLEVLAESLAAEVVAGQLSATDFAEALRERLRAAAATAKGFKTIAAYRSGFDIEWSRPTDAAVAAAVGRWTREADGQPLRLADPTLAAFLVHTALDLSRPVQFHVGFGDRDLDLHRANPLLLLGLLRQPGVGSTPVMLLHCYPYHREAGYLAQAFANVYADVGLAVNHLGAQSRQLLAESLELAPFAKLLYSSDAYGLPELHLLGSVLWRRGMAQTLGDWVRSGDWSEADAARVVRMIGADNARRVYDL